MSRQSLPAKLLPTMFSLTARTTLCVLTGLAAVIFGGGLRLARHQQSLRLDRDRDALQRFSADAQRELLRLDEAFESHLARLARSLTNDSFAIRTEADHLVGVRQVSLLHRGNDAAQDLHVPVTPVRGQRTPVPMFNVPRAGSVSAIVLVEEQTLFNDPEQRSGWIDQPGKPLMYWQRRSDNEVAVVLLDPAALEVAVSRWLQQWAVDGFAPVRAIGGPDQLRNRAGRTLAVSGQIPEIPADLLLPLRSRLGSWELASWDRREIRVRYDIASLAASSAVAVLVAILGVLVFGQQRRTSALAAQRVSFVNRVSHELRSPLTNILLNVDLAADAIDESPAVATRRLDLVQEEARRLSRLIDNVLTFSRHEQGKLRATPRACVPAGVIAMVIEQFAPSFARRSLTVLQTGDASAGCLLDADGLAQILANLLSNVEKYVPSGTVEISSTWTEGRLSIIVSDQGPGIPGHAAERIFHPFERLDSRVNEGASGTGLGLAIARDLATSMGGTLQLLPCQRGAAFALNIPAPPLSSMHAA